MLFIMHFGIFLPGNLIAREKKEMNNKTKELTEIAVCVALAVVCSFICIYRMPQGGSIALTMIPILFISFRRGPAAGIITGALYGLVSLLFSGTIYHPMSILLDYILAFALLGVAGFFGNSPKGIVLGSLAGLFGRFLSSFISGVTIFASYAPEGQSVWVYSLVYQITYMLPELIIALVVLLFLRAKAGMLFKVK